MYDLNTNPISTLEMERNILSVIRGVREEPTENLVHDGEKLNSFLVTGISGNTATLTSSSQLCSMAV